jgi:hypothetical protein
VWWYIPVIPEIWRYRQEDCKFKASLGYIVKSCFRKKEYSTASLHTNILNELLMGKGKAPQKKQCWPHWASRLGRMEAECWKKEKGRGSSVSRLFKISNNLWVGKDLGSSSGLDCSD